MANENDWTAGTHSTKNRGRLVRYYFESPDRAPEVNTGKLVIAEEPFNIKGVGYFGADDYKANQHPTRTEATNFRNLIYRNFREYLDGVGLGFRPGITDEQIGILAGDNPNLKGVRSADFVRSVGNINQSSSEVESGVKKLQMKREKTEQAITSPTAYIKEANEELKRLEEDALKIYNMSFNKYHNEYFFPLEEAKKRANEDREVYLNMLKKRYKELYSVDLEGEAKKHIIKTV